MITYCIVHWNRLKNLQRAIRRHSEHVDKTIIVDGGSTDGSLDWLTSKECTDLNVCTIIRPWDDNPPAARNTYLQAAGNQGWILCLDDDEYLEDPAIWSIKQIVEEAEKQGATSVAFNAHDIQVNEEGRIWENRSSYWSPIILFKAGPSVRYSGQTHVGLSRLPGKVIQSPFRYFHCKSTMDQWIRGARNYWTTAAPAANTTNDPTWKQFKSICAKYNLKLFADIVNLMKQGAVPQDLVNWFIANKDSNNPEARSYFVTYFIHLHPELNPSISNRDFSYSPDRKSIIGITF